jgi:hypothetical protein
MRLLFYFMETHKERSQRLDQQNKRIARLKAANLCQSCGKMPLENKTMCQKCHKRQTERKHSRILRLRESGLCQKCGQHPVINVSRKCEICTIKQTARTHLGSRKRYKELEQCHRHLNGGHLT